MSTIRQTKDRLASVKSTQKVIKAMELVASSKIKKSRDKAKNIEFFFDTTIDSLRHLYQYSNIGNVVFQEEAKEKTLIFAISSDMGLCGAYNANINKVVINEINRTEGEVELVILGKKGISKLEYENHAIAKKFIDYSNRDELELSNEITDYILNKIQTGEINGLKIVYTKFLNPLIQEVEVLDLADLEKGLSEEKIDFGDIIFDSEPVELFNRLISLYITALIYSSILQSFASEHAYRRNSMETANNNSLELIDSLNVKMNRIRQAAITQEISEIIGGSEALNKE